jgi:hypothetical protein
VKRGGEVDRLRHAALVAAIAAVTMLLLAVNAAGAGWVLEPWTGGVAAAVLAVTAGGLIWVLPRAAAMRAGPRALVAMPIVLFYGCYLLYSRNYPYCDDYNAILGFVLDMRAPHTWLEHLAALLAQHNDHRIVLVRVLSLAQVGMFGALNFRMLTLVGNCAFLLIFVLLAKGAPRTRDVEYALVPVAFLLFSFRPYEGIFWSMVSLSGFWVVAIALTSLYFLQRSARWTDWTWAVFFGGLASVTQGNGKGVWIVGVMLLGVARRRRQLLAWIAIGGIVFLLDRFLFHSFSGYGTPLARSWRNFRSSFAFLGAALPGSAGLVMGAGMLGFFVWLTVRRYFERAPFLYFALAFIVLNAIAVLFARPSASFPSRYSIYSMLFLAASYLAVIDWLHARSVPRARAVVGATTMVAVPLFLAAFAALPLGLGYYRAMVLDYERSSILSAAGVAPRTEAEITAQMDEAVRRLRDLPLARPIPDPWLRTLEAREYAAFHTSEKAFRTRPDFPEILLRARAAGIFDYEQELGSAPVR